MWIFRQYLQFRHVLLNDKLQFSKLKTATGGGPVVVQQKEAPARPNLSSKRPTVVVPDPVKTYLT